MIALKLTSWRKGLLTVSLIRAVKEYSTGDLSQAKQSVEKFLAGDTITLQFDSDEKKSEFWRKAESFGVICIE